MGEAIYRVTAKAIVRDAQDRILVLENEDHEYELPGGGWEQGEGFRECLRREFLEELGVDALTDGKIWFMYRCYSPTWDNWALRLVVKATLKSHDFKVGDTIVMARFVDKPEFLALDWTDEDRGVLDHADTLWPAVEKKPQNR